MFGVLLRGERGEGRGAKQYYSLFVFCLLTLALSSPAWATISLSQHTSKDPGTTTSSTLAFGSNNTAGNFIAVCIRGGALNQTFTVTDTRNSYQKAFSVNETGNGNTYAIYF